MIASLTKRGWEIYHRARALLAAQVAGRQQLGDAAHLVEWTFVKRSTAINSDFFNQ
jgi:hypothetical protein